MNQIKFFGNVTSDAKNNTRNKSIILLKIIKNKPLMIRSQIMRGLVLINSMHFYRACLLRCRLINNDRVNRLRLLIKASVESTSKSLPLSGLNFVF